MTEAAVRTKRLDVRSLVLISRETAPVPDSRRSFLVRSHFVSATNDRPMSAGGEPKRESLLSTKFYPSQTNINAIEQAREDCIAPLDGASRQHQRASAVKTINKAGGCSWICTRDSRLSNTYTNRRYFCLGNEHPAQRSCTGGGNHLFPFG